VYDHLESINSTISHRQNDIVSLRNDNLVLLDQFSEPDPPVFSSSSSCSSSSSFSVPSSSSCASSSSSLVPASSSSSSSSSAVLSMDEEEDDTALDIHSEEVKTMFDDLVTRVSVIRRHKRELARLDQSSVVSFTEWKTEVFSIVANAYQNVEGCEGMFHYAPFSAPSEMESVRMEHPDAVVRTISISPREFRAWYCGTEKQVAYGANIDDVQEFLDRKDDVLSDTDDSP
jgi:hypothetical protein